MYISLVRPHLEYASQVWNTYKTGEINSLKSVQKFALRMCTKQWNSSYNDLLQLCSLPTLQQRRLYQDLCTMFKIVQGLFHFPTGIFVEQTSRVTRSQSHHLFVCPHAHTSSFYNSFVPRTIHNWNMHMYSYLPLYHPINLIFGHTCEISYCTAIIIVSLAISVKFFYRSRTQF